ncbi:hypothetical protein J6590_042020 [Homalodisca vitripennis]|nr:hypothetical protein J6590_042020 [Homalodisca vitripennis]
MEKEVEDNVKFATEMEKGKTPLFSLKSTLDRPTIYAEFNKILEQYARLDYTNFYL